MSNECRYPNCGCMNQGGAGPCVTKSRQEARSALQSLQGVELPPLPEARIVSHQTDSTMRTTELRTYDEEDMHAYARTAVAAAMALGAVPQPGWTAEEIEEVIACLDDDAVTLLDVNPEDERAVNMQRAAAMIQVFAGSLAAAPTPEATQPTQAQAPSEHVLQHARELLAFIDGKASATQQPEQGEAVARWNWSLGKLEWLVPYQASFHMRPMYFAAATPAPQQAEQRDAS